MDMLEQLFPSDPANEQYTDLYVARAELTLFPTLPTSFTSEVLRDDVIIDRAFDNQRRWGGAELWDPLTGLRLVKVENEGVEMYVSPDSQYFSYVPLAEAHD